MKVSVIIPTNNRARRLPDLFDDFAKLEMPKGLTWEFLIIDNASKDETPEIIRHEIARGRLPLVHLHEPLTGKSRALNSAMAKSTGDLIVFTDDDVSPTTGWLTAYYEASQKYHWIEGFGGRVLPLWEEGAAPSWLSDELESSLPDALFCRCDMGETEKLFADQGVPGGGNAALKRDAIKKMREFREDIGPGTLFPYAEDTEYFRRLYRGGGHYVYLPSALIYHKNPTYRMTKSHVLRRTYHCARSEVQIHDLTEVKRFCGVPRYLLKQAGERLLLSTLSFRERDRFPRLRLFVGCIGEIVGHIQRNRLQGAVKRPG